jgi:sec-independent protein translocase protein TatB
VFNVTGLEIVILLLVALVVLGPERLPDAVRKFGAFYREFKNMSTGFQSELRQALDEPMRELRETADLAKGLFDEPTAEFRESGDSLSKTANEIKDIFSGKALSAAAPKGRTPKVPGNVDPVLAAQIAEIEAIGAADGHGEAEETDDVYEIGDDTTADESAAADAHTDIDTDTDTDTEVAATPFAPPVGAAFAPPLATPPMGAPDRSLPPPPGEAASA